MLTKAGEILGKIEVDETIDKEVEEKFFMELNLNDLKKTLESHLKKLIGSKVSLYLKLEKSRRGSMMVDIISDEIAHSPKIFKSLKIHNFGGSLSPDGSYWLPIHYTWTNFSMGSNGTEICIVWIDKYSKIQGNKDVIK